jgi:peptidoglycan/LPS O-acetylase OafA/YrhL
MSPAPASRHFLALDALRGVAAFCVMFFHASAQRLTCGYLGVDLFFILSGFVIALSYQERLDGGFTLREFMLRRLIRLYPMIFAAALGGLLAVLVGHTQDALSAPRALGQTFVAALLVLPHPNGTAFGIETFPLNTVVWSLFFELVANAAYAAGLYRLKLPAVAALSAACLVAVGFLGQLGGVQAQNFWAGFPRVGFGFFAGVALFHLWRVGYEFPVQLRLVPLACLLVVIFLTPFELEGFAAVPALLAFVVIVAMAVRIEDAACDMPSLTFLGAISYPLYALHMPLLGIVRAAIPAFEDPQGLALLPALAVEISVIVLVSWAAERWYEKPARAWLATRFAAPRAALRRAQA